MPFFPAARQRRPIRRSPCGYAAPERAVSPRHARRVAGRGQHQSEIHETVRAHISCRRFPRRGQLPLAPGPWRHRARLSQRGPSPSHFSRAPGSRDHPRADLLGVRAVSLGFLAVDRAASDEHGIASLSLDQRCRPSGPTPCGSFRRARGSCLRTSAWSPVGITTATMRRRSTKDRPSRPRPDRGRRQAAGRRDTPAAAPTRIQHDSRRPSHHAHRTLRGSTTPGRRGNRRSPPTERDTGRTPTTPTSTSSSGPVPASSGAARSRTRKAGSAGTSGSSSRAGDRDPLDERLGPSRRSPRRRRDHVGGVGRLTRPLPPLPEPRASSGVARRCRLRFGRRAREPWQDGEYAYRTTCSRRRRDL